MEVTIGVNDRLMAKGNNRFQRQEWQKGRRNDERG